MHTETYRGEIRESGYGDGDDFLWIGDGGVDNEPLASIIKDVMSRKGNYLSIRYWTADRPLPDAELKAGAIAAMLGAADVEWRQHYSEITGYLWTDEQIKVGGHDLLDELMSQKGRYCLLEIDYSTEQP